MVWFVLVSVYVVCVVSYVVCSVCVVSMVTMCVWWCV